MSLLIKSGVSQAKDTMIEHTAAAVVTVTQNKANRPGTVFSRYDLKPLISLSVQPGIGSSPVKNPKRSGLPFLSLVHINVFRVDKNLIGFEKTSNFNIC